MMVDWWSLGILLYEIVAGTPPFNERNQMRLLGDIQEREHPKKDYFTKNFTSLIDGLLDKNPLTRLGKIQNGVENVQEIKNHVFFEGVDWAKVYTKEIPAPFKPKCSGDGDLKNVDKLYLNEPVKNTPEDDDGIRMTMLNHMHLNQFTYDEGTNNKDLSRSESKNKGLLSFQYDINTKRSFASRKDTANTQQEIMSSDEPSTKLN